MNNATNNKTEKLKQKSNTEKSNGQDESHKDIVIALSR